MNDAFEWDPRAARYRNVTTGRYVSRDEVKRSLDGALRAVQGRIEQLTVRYRDGALDLAGFETGMRQEIKNSYLYAGAIAKGGWDRMDASDFGRIGAAVKEQYRTYLARFVDQLRADEQPLDGRFRQRALLYATSAKKFWQIFAGDVAEGAGYTEERNVRHAMDSCAGCLAAEAMGWQPIGTLPPIGTRDCLGNCLCSIDYR